jgi:serine/threonine protein kinase
VLKSDPSRKVYARKQVYLARRRRNAIFEQLKQEALIIRSLHHRHIVEVVGTYTWSSRFSIIMLPVADTDLGKYLEELDSTIEEMTMKQQVERLRRTNQFNTWIVCLILAVDYLHEKRIKHRDIKPSNILVRNNTIYLTDFGTSRIIPEDATTGTASIYGPMTRRYVAPEALRDSERRGRSTDIFSLGCVFLEMATIQKGHNGARDRFSKLRHDSTGLSSFAENPYATLQWINYLGSLGAGSKCHALDLAFLMLDPDSKQRITARQLITVIVTISTEEERPGMQLSSCDKCYQAILETDPSSLHSRFRAEARRDYPEDPEAALNTPPPHNWEAAKKKWLHSHMWWTN